jgi:hypothetical protein
MIHDSTGNILLVQYLEPCVDIVCRPYLIAQPGEIAGQLLTQVTVVINQQYIWTGRHIGFST